MKKIFALLLTVILLVSIMPTVSLAKEEPIHFGKYSFDFDKTYSWFKIGDSLDSLYIKSSGTDWVSATSEDYELYATVTDENVYELHLRNADLVKTLGISCATATIILEGDSTIMVSSDAGIWSRAKDLTITGMGILTIGSSENRVLGGFYSNNGNITLSGANINIYDKFDGINTNNGSINIYDSNVYINDLGRTPINPGTCWPPVCAIHANGNVNIKDSNVLASSTNAYGIYATGDLTVENSEVIAHSAGKYAASATNFYVIDSIAYQGTDLCELDNNKVVSDYYTYFTVTVTKDVPAPIIVEETKAIPVPEPVLERNGIPVVYIGEDKDEIKVEVDIDTYINGESIFSANAPIFIENGRTYLGVRDMAYALNIDPMAIKWNDETKTATISKSGATIEVTEGSDIIKMTYKGYIYEIPTDASAKIKDGRIYLPFRAIFELFGYEVNWDNETRTITCK